MPRASAQQREAQKISTPLPGGGYAASVGDVPSQATWKEHSSSLLSSMPGDRKRRKKTLESVISALLRKREEFRREKKTGAGVTTEAIEFYQFVMDINTTWKGSNNKNNNSKQQQQQQKDDDRKKRKKLKKKRGVGRPRKKSRVEESEYDNDDDEEKSGGEEDDGECSESGSVPETDDDSDVSSMDEEEFLRQHNDLCEVCNTGGELLCCATCNLVFHMKCARPSLKVMPPDEWSCAHCDATGVTGFKRESRKRKRAAQAVREMDKMRNELLRGQQNEDEKEIETMSIKVKIRGSFENIFTPPASSSHSEGTTTPPPVDIMKKKIENDKNSESNNLEEPTNDDNNNNSSITTRKNSEDAIIIGHSGTNKREVDQIVDSLSPLNFLSPRSRRSRRQPTLYDPQLGSASEWQSDGKNEWKYLSKEENGGLEAVIPKKMKENKTTTTPASIIVKKEQAVVPKETEAPKKAPIRMSPEQKAAIQKLIAKPIQPGRVSRYVSVQCKFCMDDETLEVCCFCACRICFSKHEKEKTILCDMCDAEYHMFCLDPPLSSIPSDDWYCPTCQHVIAQAQKQEIDTSTNKRVSTPSKRYQSPTSSNKSNKKRDSTKKEKESPLIKKETPTTNVDLIKVSSNKKKVSEQPSSTLSTEHVAHNVIHESSPSTPAVPPKRGRGRPRKYPRPPDKIPAPKGKPGRKPKSMTNTTNMEPKASPVILESTSYAMMHNSIKDSQQLIQSNSGGGSHMGAQVVDHDGKIRIKCSQGDDVRKVVEGQFDDASSSCGSDLIKPESTPNISNTDHPPPMFDSSGGLVSSSRSRSGRTVKRNAFHDEIGEDEQRLKARSSSMDDRKVATVVLVPTLTTSKPLTVINTPATTTTNSPVVVTSNNNSIAKDPVSREPSTINPTLESFSKSKPDANATTTISNANNNINQGSLPSPKWKENNTKQIIGTNNNQQQQAQSQLQSKTSNLIDPIPAPNTATATATAIMNKSKSSSPVPGPTTTVSPTPAPKEPLVRVPRRKPGARECMQISRRFGVNVIPQKYMDIMMDYCSRGKVEHLIRMRERLDDHSKFLESQIAGLEAAVAEKGELDIVVPPFDAK